MNSNAQVFFGNGGDGHRGANGSVFLKKGSC